MEAPHDPGEATRLLRAVAGGAPDAEQRRQRLLALVYDELRALADRAMAGERAEHTLQPTALVHEAWIRLLDGRLPELEDRRHLLSLSARAMRRILVDHARARRRVKRGGSWIRAELDVELAPAAPRDDEVDLVALEGALGELERAAPRAAQVVELRYFGGFGVEETARALEVSESSVAREWRFARAWLTRRLEEGA